MANAERAPFTKEQLAEMRRNGLDPKGVRVVKGAPKVISADEFLVAERSSREPTIEPGDELGFDIQSTGTTTKRKSK